MLLLLLLRPHRIHTHPDLLFPSMLPLAPQPWLLLARACYYQAYAHEQNGTAALLGHPEP